jgi:hypothetical protein
MKNKSSSHSVDGLDARDREDCAPRADMIARARMLLSNPGYPEIGDARILAGNLLTILER